MIQSQHAIAFDTHQMVEDLVGVGFNKEQAEVLTRQHVDFINANLATKSDIKISQQNIELAIAETRNEIANVYREIEQFRKETNKEIANIYKEIARLRKETKDDNEMLRKETKDDNEMLRKDLKLSMYGMTAATITILGGLMTILTFIQ